MPRLGFRSAGIFAALSEVSEHVVDVVIGVISEAGVGEKLAARDGAIVLMVSHRPENLRLADHVQPAGSAAAGRDRAGGGAGARSLQQDRRVARAGRGLSLPVRPRKAPEKWDFREIRC